MDEIDLANERAEQDLAKAIASARCEIKPGIAGECSRCGETSLRLIGGACAPCRDKHGLA